MRSGSKLAALGAAALLVMGAAPAGMGWTSKVGTSANGQPLLGNPASDVILTEYVSYTCRDCYTFALDGDAVLKLAYVPSGRLAREVQLLGDSPVELAAAMLAHCGPPGRFFVRHTALLYSQRKWLPMLTRATGVQRGRWSQPGLGNRNRAIAGDMGFYAIMASTGLDRLTVDRCLADQALADRIARDTAAAHDSGVVAAPSFAINGKLLNNTTTWASLRPQLDESLK